jgi:hypothetical protein
MRHRGVLDLDAELFGEFLNSPEVKLVSLSVMMLFGTPYR